MQSEPRPAVKGPPGAVARLLQKAAKSYARGDLQSAEGWCRQLLQASPDQPDALHILGLVAWRRGERQQALDVIRNVIAGNPNKPQLHNSLGVMLKELGDPTGAEAALRTAIDLMPNYPEALTNLGNILCETGRFADAEAMHRRAVEIAPRYADGHNNLATALAKQELWAETLAECRIAVGLQPTRAEFHLNLGNALSGMEDWKEAAAAFQCAAGLAPKNADAHANLGIALYHLDQPDQAAAAHRTATELRPDSARIWTNLAAAQVDLGDPDSALGSCQRALEIDPNLPEAYNCLGLALKAKGMGGQAITAYETAIRLRPDYHKAYSNLGIILHAQGRFADALAAYAKAVEIVPDYLEAQWNKGMLHLLLGEFEFGWSGYELGLDMKRPRVRFRYRQFDMWEGATIAGKTIVVSGEQGVGDQIMFASLLPDLVERGAKLLVKLENRLYPLLQRSIDGLTLLPPDDAGSSSIEQFAVDYQAPIGSLCRWLRPNLASFPSRSGYLKADLKQVETFRQRYRQQLGERPTIGISWRGGFKEAGQLRSIPLTSWAPILKQQGFGFVNLQYGDCHADLAAVQNELGVTVFHDDAVDPLKSLDDFAAQTAAMDLVISIDNSTVHMAGALNVPVWVLLPAVPDWRWMLNRSDSPWYSSVRLFRQPRLGEWSPVIATVAEELGRMVDRSGVSLDKEAGSELRATCRAGGA